MDTKNTTKKNNKKKKIKYSDIKKNIFPVIKNIFFLTVIIFFTNLLFVWSKFFEEISILFLPFTYLIFIINLFLFIFWFLKEKFKLNKALVSILWIICTGLTIASYLPFLI